MGKGVAENAIGAILEIPPTALEKINKAQRYIENLQIASNKASEAVSKHWGERATSGLAMFIDKLAEAKRTMDSLGTINVTLNTNAAVKSGEQLSSQMQKTSADVSKAVQDMSASWSDLGKVNIKGFNISNYGNNLTEVLARLTQLKQDFKNEPIGSGRNQAMADEIRQLEEAVRLYKQAAEEKNKALANIQQKQQNEKDKAYLDEQKRLLDRILQLRKDISQISISVQRGTITGKTDMSADLAQLEKLRKELRETGWAYRDLRTFQSQAISEDARIKAEIQSQNAKNAGLRQEVDERNKLAAAITRANELTAQGQQGKTRLGSGEEAAIQRQLNSDYKNQLKILKEIGEIKAKAAEQGKALTINSAEVQLIQALAQRYRVYAEDVNRVAGAYRTMGEAAAKNFAADRSEQLARNAIMLADAQKKAEGNTKQLTAEYKRLYAENQRLFESQRKYMNNGGTPQSITTGTAPQDQAYRDMATRRQDVLQRMLEIERKNIQEVADFRLQKEMEANQKIISDFVQAEAQKKAAAEKSAQEQAEAQKRRLQEYLQTAQGAMWQARQVTSGKGTGDLATNIENIKRAINDLKAASGSLNLLNPADVQKAEQLKKKIAELEALLKRYKNAATPDKLAINPQDAIQAAKTATTLRELERAYKGLKEAMANTSASDPMWSRMNTQLQTTKKSIDDIKAKMGELNNQSTQTANIMGQLQSRIAAAFSIGAITGFAKKVVDVRAQFELQNVALRAILQNKDEADRIFNQVQQMALQSPFTIMQLTTYTKQLAAYRVESEKLVGTTKMLADVSAGLGVDISRLILAYGQVKSANYLRATEVRQFTEAGLNIAGELANYFSELQGKMISVGDVMEMITKRMVRFEDVEEVFKRVTSAGGMFYDMQKKQSETLHGQMQRITDAYSIMMNEIGKSQGGVIAESLTLIRSLISGWREVLAAIKAAGAGFAAYIVVIKLAKLLGAGAFKEMIVGAKLLIADMKTATFWTNAFSNAWRAAMSSTGIGLIIAALATFLTYLWQTREAASALNEELSNIGQNSVNDMQESISNFIMLADTISDTSKTHTEHQEALDEMNRAYKDILPAEKLQMDYIKQMNGDYRELTATIAEYYQQMEYQKKYEAIMDSDQAKKVEDEIYRTLKRAQDDNNLGGMILSDGQIRNWANTFAKELTTGKIPRSIDGLKDRMNEVFKGASFSKYTFEAPGRADLTDVLSEYEKLESKLGDISLATTQATDAFGQFSDNLSNLNAEQLGEKLSVLEERAAKLRNSLSEQERKSVEAGLNPDNNTTVIKQREELENLEYQIRAVEEAQMQLASQAYIQKIQEGTDEITDQIKAYYQASKQMKEYAATGSLTEEQQKELNAKMDAAWESANNLSAAFGGVSRKALDAMDSEYDLEQQCNSIAERAFPTLAKKAMSTFNSVQIAVLKGKRGFAKFAEFVNGWSEKLGFKVFDITGNTVAEINKEIEALEKGAKRTTTSVNNVAKEAQEVRNQIAKKHGVSASVLDIPKPDTASLKQYAQSIRKEAELGIQAYNDYNAAVAKGQKEVNGKINGYTREEIEYLKRKSDAYNEYADKLYVEAEKKKKTRSRSRGKDPELKMWENRLDAVKRYYDGAEKARQKLSESETKEQQTYSMKDLFAHLGMDKVPGLSLNELLAKGFDPKTLKYEFAEALKVLLKYVPAQYSELRTKIQETIASESIEIQFKIAAEQKEKLQQSITELFDNYELTKELRGVGVPIEMTYMLGGKPTELADVRKEYFRLMEDFVSKSEEEQDVIKKMGEDIRKKEMSAQKQQLKNYVKYLTESMVERVQIELNAQREISKIRQDKNLDEFSKQQAIFQRTKKMQDELAQYDFNQFKASDVYTNVFKDLERASKDQLQYVIDKFKELQRVNENLSPTQVKAIASELKKAEDALAEKSAYSDMIANLKNAVKYAKERNTLLEKQQGIQTQLDVAQRKLEASQRKLYDLQVSFKSVNQSNTEEWNEAALKVGKQQGEVKMLLQLVKNLKQQLAGVTGETEAGERAWGNFRGALTRFSKGMKEVRDSVGAVFDGLDSMGLVSDSFRDVYESMNEVLDGVDTFISALEGMDITKPFSIITGSIKAIGGIFKSIGGLFSFGDKKKARQIKKLSDKVEELDKAYQSLEKSIEAAYTFDDYNAGYEQMQKNLQQRKHALSEMIALEESKKKSDKDKIKEYKNELAEIAEAEKELHDQRIEAMGSTKDYLSQAENFVSAWLDAYKETGSGLDALKGSWEEFVENLFVKQAAAQIVSSRLKGVIDIINNAIDSRATGFDLAAAVNQAREEWTDQAEIINTILEQLYKSYGLGMTEGEFLLSDLQKGIQNITEPQAAAIEAYMNSIRMAVFQHTEQLNTLIATIQMQYGEGAENPIVSELKGIRIVLDSIDNRLDSVIDTRMGGGAALRMSV